LKMVRAGRRRRSREALDNAHEEAMRISSERDDAVNEAQRAASQLQGERDQLLRNVEDLEKGTG